MVRIPLTLALLFCSLHLLAFPLTVYAATKTAIAEATYLMGEGETPAMAESKAFDVAKQKAVDQLLPFVAEQAIRSKYPFPTEDIRAIAEATIEIEVLDKQRMVIGQRFQFTAKVKAMQRQDQVLAEVARKEKRLGAEKLTKEGQSILHQILRHQIDEMNQKEKSHDNSAEYEKALALFNQAIDTDPTFSGAYSARYRVYRWYLSRVDKALADITKAIQLETIGRKQAEFYVLRAMTNKELGKNDQALADYSEAIIRDPKPSYVWKRGEMLSERGQYEKAVFDYSMILEMKLSKDDEMYRKFALSGRAHAYGDLKQYNRALADYADLIRLTNGNDGYGSRGLVYMRLKEYDKAVADFTEEIIHRPSNESPTEAEWTKTLFLMRALAYQQLGQSEKVIPDITEYLRRGPPSKQEAASAYERRGQAHSATKKADNALADFTEAIQADPNRASAYYRRGMQYAFMRVWDRAVMDLTEALRLTTMDSAKAEGKLDDKDMVRAYTMRGQAHLNLDHPDQSLSDLNEALRRNPKENHAMFVRGLAHAQLKDTNMSLRNLREACQLGHDEACEAAQSVH